MATRTTRQRRAEIGAALGSAHAGVAHRRELRAAGVTRHDVASEVSAGRWQCIGRHTVAIGAGRVSAEALPWLAVWETGAGAALDGAAALTASGLVGFRPRAVDVALPASNRSHPVDGVRLRRRREVGQVIGVGIPRVRVEVATIHAAQWARTDREAALLICLVVQQRLLPIRRLLDHWRSVTYSPRRQLIDSVVRDVCGYP